MFVMEMHTTTINKLFPFHIPSFVCHMTYIRLQTAKENTGIFIVAYLII